MFLLDRTYAHLIQNHLTIEEQQAGRFWKVLEQCFGSIENVLCVDASQQR